MSSDKKMVDEFDRLVDDGGPVKVELEERYNCDKGSHKWLPYTGVMYSYYYCGICDKKDVTRQPDPKR